MGETPVTPITPEFGMINGSFHNNDGLIFRNASGGFMNIYDNEDNFIRRFGFGITSNEFNRSVNDFNWEWSYQSIENLSYFDLDLNETVYYNSPIWRWTAEFNGGAGTWIQTYDFNPISKLKITHYIENQAVNLTGAKFWYMFTVNENDTAKYNNQTYNLSINLHLQGNLSHLIPRIDFPFESFDFTDILEDYTITDLYVGEADMFSLPQRIVGVGVAKDVGGSDFPLGRNHTLDPTIFTNVSDDISTLINVSTENNFSHLNTSNVDPYNDLALYFPFDTNNSQLVQYDYSPQEGDGVIFGATNIDTLCNGYGTCRRFDGVVAGDRGVVTVEELDGNGWFDVPWSITFWMKANGTANIQEIVGNQGNPQQTGGIGFYIRKGANRIQYRAFNGTEGDFLQTPNGIIKQDTWIHVAVTTFSQKINIYMNGTLRAGSGDFPLLPIVSGERPSADFNIGRASSTGRTLNGSLDEVMVFNHTLTAEEVLEIFDNTSQRFYGSGEQTFKELNYSGINSGDQNQVNVSIEQLLNVAFVNFTTQIGDAVNNANYSFGTITQIDTTTGRADNINIITPNNQSLSIQFHADNNSFYTPIILNTINQTSWTDPCIYLSGNWNTTCGCGVNTELNLSGNNITINHLKDQEPFFNIKANVRNVDVFSKLTSCIVIKANEFVVT